MEITLILVFVCSLGIIIGRWIYIGQPKYISAMKDSDVFEVLTKWKNGNFHLVILKNVNSKETELYKLEFLPDSQYIQLNRICHGGSFIGTTNITK